MLKTTYISSVLLNILLPVQKLLLPVLFLLLPLLPVLTATASAESKAAESSAPCSHGRRLSVMVDTLHLPCTLRLDSVAAVTLEFPNSGIPNREYTQEVFVKPNLVRFIHWTDKTPSVYCVAWPATVAVRFERKGNTTILLCPLTLTSDFELSVESGEYLEY